MKMTEKFVETKIRKYLTDKKKWKITNELKQKGEHGADIEAKRKDGTRHLIVEVKGWSTNNQYNHNNFYHLLGQIISRVEKPQPKKYKYCRYYALGVTKEFANMMNDKINAKQKSSKPLREGWKILGDNLNLNVYVVDRKGPVVEKRWKEFLE